MAQRKEIDDLVNKIVSDSHWHVIIQPEKIKPERINTLMELWNLMETCRVTLRGWDYPHVDRKDENRGYGKDWIESWCEFFMGHQEYWSFHQNVTFNHYFSFWEDGDIDEVAKRAKSSIPLMQDDFKPSGYLSVLSTLYSFTEIFEFASRLAQKGIFENSVLISISMLGIQNRLLFFWEWTQHLNRPYISKLNKLERKKVYGMQELMSNSHEISISTMSWFFERFQWYEQPIDVFREEQQKFLERKIM